MIERCCWGRFKVFETNDLHTNMCGCGSRALFWKQHFVVYKVPALVGSVSAYTDCDVEFDDSGSGVEVTDDRPAVPGYKVEKKAEADEAISIVLKHFNLDPMKRGIKIHFGGDLTAVSGIGASAAQVVALSRAIGVADQMNLSDEAVNAAGYEGEKGYHGTPSGIDNTAATYGGLLKFQRTEGVSTAGTVLFFFFFFLHAGSK